MNGTTAAQAAAPTPARFADTRWQIRGIADFNGDGYPDLLWHHQTTGELYVWFMGNGAGDAAGVVPSAPAVSVIGASFLTPSRYADTNWQIRGVADFNADGKADILWHNQSTGDLYVWFLGPAVTDLKTGLGLVSPSTVVTGGSFLTPSRFADTRWQIRAVADFNGDSKPDILWHHQLTGDVYAWLMNGTAVTTGSYTTPSRVADTRWQIQRVADFNSDGQGRHPLAPLGDRTALRLVPGPRRRGQGARRGRERGDGGHGGSLPHALPHARRQLADRAAVGEPRNEAALRGPASRTPAPAFFRRPGGGPAYRLSSTACVVTQYFASMLAFSHFGRVAGSFR